MYQFPKDVYADIRIEEKYYLWLEAKNGDLESDGMTTESGAMIRVFDGNMWYIATTNNLSEIQKELDNLVTLAIPNPNISEHPVVKKFQVHNENIVLFDKDTDVRKISRQDWKKLLDYYIEKCVDESISELSLWNVYCDCYYLKKSFYSSKGASIIQDNQECCLGVVYGITVDGVTSYPGKRYRKFQMDELYGHEEEVLEELKRGLDFAKNAQQLEPGQYTCILGSRATAVFTHESFGHKSESDFMLNDKVLQDEWELGKQVGNPKISICDRGDWFHAGYTPYDDEGTKATETWLMKDGVLAGRLHDANSAVVLGEELTGSARARDYSCAPMVRMTNTFMERGEDDPEQMIAEVKDGIYIYDVYGGTGQAIFTMDPFISYRIRDGKLCEPIRINVVTGNVFETLFDVDAVGTDLELFDAGSCGKNGQWVKVTTGGPSIRVKKMTVN